MTSRNHSGVAFPATVVVVVVLLALLAYPLSIGPAIWICDQDWSPEWAWPAYWQVYDPIISVCNEGPAPFDDALNWYVNLWR